MTETKTTVEVPADEWAELKRRLAALESEKAEPRPEEIKTDARNMASLKRRADILRIRHPGKTSMNDLFGVLTGIDAARAGGMSRALLSIWHFGAEFVPKKTDPYLALAIFDAIDHRHEAMNYGGKWARLKLVTPSSGAALFTILAAQSRHEAASFFRHVAKGGTALDAAPVALRKRLEGHAEAPRGWDLDRRRMAWAIQAWNCQRQGRPVEMNWRLEQWDEPFPEAV